MSYAKDVERLGLLQSTLEKARGNAEAQEILGGVGFPAEEIEQAQKLHDTAWQLIGAQTEAVDAYNRACKALTEAEAEVDANYAIDRANALRALAEDTIAQTTLGVSGKQDTTMTGRFEHARKLYTTKLPEAATALLEKKGLPATRRSERMAKVYEEQTKRTAMDTALAAQTKATDARDHAIKLALTWLTEFRTVARKAFKTKPHLLTLFDL